MFVNTGRMILIIDRHIGATNSEMYLNQEFLSIKYSSITSDLTFTKNIAYHPAPIIAVLIMKVMILVTIIFIF